MNIWLDLFLTFFKVGLCTFGGGYAMIAVIEHACVENKQWIDHEEMMNITVIAESTPGPIAINCATFVGYKQKGTIGAILATLGVVLPSFLIIFLISNLMDDFLAITWVAHAFQGIKLAVGLLILDAAFRMIGKMKKSPLSCVILICAALVMLSVNIWSIRVSSIWIMLTGGAVSLAVFLAEKHSGGAGDRS